MDHNGHWTLSPAFDITWAYRSDGPWTNRHQMRLNGKQDDFTRRDLLAAAEQYGIKDRKSIIDKVGESIGGWPHFAKQAGVSDQMIKKVGRTHRLDLAK